MTKMIFKGNFKEIISSLFVKYVNFYKLDSFKARLCLYTCFMNAYRVIFNIIIPEV